MHLVCGCSEGSINTLLGEKLDIVLDLWSILQAKKSLKNLFNLDPLEWPTVKLVCNRLMNGNDYQGTTLKNFNEATLKSCKDQALADVRKICEKGYSGQMLSSCERYWSFSTPRHGAQRLQQLENQAQN